MDPMFFGAENINTGGLRVSASGGVGEKTISRTLDSLELPHVDFMKIDIQGSELRALKGASRILSRDRPFIFIEVEERHLNSLGSSSKELIEFILSQGYCLYRIRTQYPCDHICTPIEKDAAFRIKVLSRFPYEVDEIRGTRVQLSFAQPGDQNYDRIDVYE